MICVLREPDVLILNICPVFIACGINIRQQKKVKRCWSNMAALNFGVLFFLIFIARILAGPISTHKHKHASHAPGGKLVVLFTYFFYFGVG